MELIPFDICLDEDFEERLVDLDDIGEVVVRDGRVTFTLEGYPTKEVFTVSQEFKKPFLKSLMKHHDNYTMKF